LFGNALNETTWEDIHADNVSTVVGMTTNNRVNYLAGKMAKEKFLVPQIAISQSPSGEFNDTEPENRNLLFAAPVGLDEWMHKMQLDEAGESSLLVEKEMSCKQWIADNKINLQETLPILIEDKKGKIRLFSSECSLQAGDKILVLTVEK